MNHIVLYEPEIPQNTGNIMRTCMAFQADLHLIEPLGFYMDEKHLKRAGMDYRDSINIYTYPNWEEFTNKNKGTYYYFTRYGHKTPDEFDFSNTDEEIFLVFGKESTGIPKDILKSHLDTCIRIPMIKDARSLNLSNCVAICLYEVISQQGYPNLSKDEYLKGKDFLDKF